MKLRIIYGRAGTGKSEFCFNEISNLLKKEKNIYIITPEQFSYTAEKKLMSKLPEGAVFNAEVITFTRMAYRVISEIGGIVNAGLSKSGKAMLVFSILNSKKQNLKFLNKSDENIDICLNAISEFKKHGITITKLKEEIRDTKNQYLKAKLEDITTVYEDFQDKISDNYIDDTDLLSILADKIEQTNMFDNSIIYIDEFSGFTKQEYDIIKELLKIAKCVNITACTDELKISKSPDTDIFYSNKITVSKILELLQDEEKLTTIESNSNYRFKNTELYHLEQNLYSNTYKKFEDKPKNINVFLAKNQYSEIENVAKNIVLNVKQKGYRYKDIAVITKNLQTYSSQIRAIFNEYNIPVFIDENRELSQNHVIQFILSIFEIFNKNWSHDAMFNYLKKGFCNIELADIFKLENYCMKWGIKHNKWKKEFVYGKDSDENKKEIEYLEQLRKAIVEPLQNLEKNINKEKTVEKISKEIYHFLVDQKFESKLQEKIEKLNDLGKSDIANEYKESFKIFINILDEMCSIFSDEKITMEKYINILKVGFKNSGLGKIPQVADQVIVGDVDRTRSHRVKIIFIIGLNDGVFPSVNRDEGFLNDSDRLVLKEDGIELAKGTLDRLYEDNYNIYKAFSTAEEIIYLSYASSDSDGKALRQSVLIPKIKRIFPNIQEKSDFINNKMELLTKTTTFEELINNINGIKYGKQIEKKWIDVYKYYKNNQFWYQKLQYSLKGLEYTNMPEKINVDNIDRLYGNTINTSVSKLEKYRSCPFSYYLQYGLRLKERQQLKVQNINTGTFMHETIDLFFNRLRNKEIKIEDITDEQIKTIVNDIIDEELQLNKNYIFTSSEKYKLLVLRLKRIVAKALKYIIETLNQSKFDILGTEVEFGQKGKYKPIILDLDDGKRIEITGKIDRIDIGKNDNGKYLRIIDYKSSSRNIDLNEVYAGLQIQLLTYMDAVCKEEDAISAGVLYFNLLEQMIKSDKRMESNEIEEKIKTNFKMKGLILANINVVKMHDKNLITGASKLIPAYIDKSGNLSKKTNGITEEQFIELQKYISKTIKEISMEILSGKIDLNPFYKNGNTPCKYCTYKAICGFNAGFCKNSYNFIGNESKDAVLAKIKKENN